MTTKTKKEYLIYKLSDEMKGSTRMDAALFKKLDVKRGLRNEDGTGVLVGLTNIGNVVGYDRKPDGSIEPIEGRLYFRGYEVRDLVHAIMAEKRFGYEEICFLLLSGRLPDAEELQSFKDLVYENMPLEQKTILHIIELEGDDIMNILARSVLEFYTFDENPDDVSRDNLMRQSIELISKFPATIAYAYNMYRHHHHGRSLHIRDAQPGLSLAENFLYMLKGADYTPLDARTLDLLLILHSEHGGGNNSTFTVRVTSSTGTDTFSSIAAGIGSLKGPKHGGANLKVSAQLEDFKANIQHWENEGEVADYIRKILRKEAGDRSGLVYGMGHAVYTLSDPRAVILKKKAFQLAKGKEIEREFLLLDTIERLTPVLMKEERGIEKAVCANVDMYSGLVYRMLEIPQDLYTPLFAVSRMAGWSAHRMEELMTGGRIIRPAYKALPKKQHYVPITER